ncbi:hypothetical protein ACFOEV_06865, partial [Litchfieldella rifensis]
PPVDHRRGAWYFSRLLWWTTSRHRCQLFGIQHLLSATLDDSYNDFRAASSNGMRFVGITADPSGSPFPDDVVSARDLHGLEDALARL